MAGLTIPVVLLVTSAAAAETYYVATSGDDGAAGDADHPWRTVQHAADSAGPGDRVIVREGYYDEDVVIDSGGSSDALPLSFDGVTEGDSPDDRVWHTKLNSLVVNGDYVAFAGFEVEALDDRTGIRVNGSRVSIRACHIHDCANRGILVALEADGVAVVGNLVRHNGLVGIDTRGSNSLLEGNEISRTVQWHPRHPAGAFAGEDADGFRVFGGGHIIRNNYVHDIADPADPGNHQGYLEGTDDWPHPDCLQTWDVADGRSEQCMTEALIEGNRFHVAAYAGKGITITSTSSMDSTCEHILVRNNIFEFRDTGIAGGDIPIRGLRIVNNLFKARPTGVEDWGFGVLLDAADYQVLNNIFVDCQREARTLSGTGVVGYSLIWSHDGAGRVGVPALQSSEFQGEDPLFVGYTPSHGGDYHLQEGSPARDRGTSDVEVTDDRDGVARPVGPAFDLGPYEFDPDVCTPSDCAGLGRECGSWDNGCGHMVDCGGCDPGATCSAVGRCVDDVVDGGTEADARADGEGDGVGSDEGDAVVADGTAPDDAAAPDAGPPGAESDGCGCRAAGSASGLTWLLGPLLFGFVLGRVRFRPWRRSRRSGAAAALAGLLAGALVSCSDSSIPGGPGDAGPDGGGDGLADLGVDPGPDAEPGADGDVEAGRDAEPEADAVSDAEAEAEVDAGPGYCAAATGLVNPPAGMLGHTDLARWQLDRSAALSINFDDSTPGQALRGVPLMIEFGLTGTWFVNPGRDEYASHREVWETIAPANFQELANHTMSHRGAATYEEASWEIGEAARIIRGLYPPERSPLMGFNRGGGTTWGITEDELAALLVEHRCVERAHSRGIAVATSAATISTDLAASFTEGSWVGAWGNIHFHGICDPADRVNCACTTPGDAADCRDSGVGGVSADEFRSLLVFLTTDPFFAERVWIDGFIAVHKYRTARDGSAATLYSAGDDEVIVCLGSGDLDPALYDEPLTLQSVVPSPWTACTAVQGGAPRECRLAGGVASYEARLGGGDIRLAPR
ncbi:MAG: right-handed parallel beta-helix repeat-containing protein [Deltaproteobacteria bacterium]|nr:right-handed parallel beta-helix repeat-containing protein [Deltaproteobacteria bacterium]